jgi:hypothetical protein
MEQKKKNAAEQADVHVVCARCYRDLRKRNIDDFTVADRERGYVLAKRAQFDRLSPREKPLDMGKLHEGRVVKLGFSPIPSTSPISLERMWVNVTCMLRGGQIHGALANDPELFKRKTLKADDTVVFSAKNILDVIPETKKTAKAAEAAEKAAKKAAAKANAKAKAAARRGKRRAR